MIPDDLIRPNAFADSLHTSYFITVGRALSVAQHFENICRAVADFRDIKKAIFTEEASPEDTEFPDFVERLRRRMLGGAVKVLGGIPEFPTDFATQLNKAKDARNRIAHDSTLSMFHPLADEDALWSSLESLLTDIRVIGEADAMVCAMLYYMNEHERLFVPRDYVSTIVRWVFKEFEGEDFLDDPNPGEQGA